MLEKHCPVDKTALAGSIDLPQTTFGALAGSIDPPRATFRTLAGLIDPPRMTFHALGGSIDPPRSTFCALAASIDLSRATFRTLERLFTPWLARSTCSKSMALSTKPPWLARWTLLKGLFAPLLPRSTLERLFSRWLTDSQPSTDNTWQGADEASAHPLRSKLYFSFGVIVSNVPGLLRVPHGDGKALEARPHNKGTSVSQSD